MNHEHRVSEETVQEPLTAEPLRIRRYQPKDKRAVRRLHDDALNEVGAHLGSGGWDDDLDEIESVYLESGGEFLVGVLDGDVVAMGALKWISPEKAELTRMRIRPGLQGRGYGQRMLDALHRRAAALGYSILCLDTTIQQLAAQRLYLKNGYSETGRGVIGPFDCIFYEKDILG
jgi:GNAT superfamily N-acetyltransferase